MEQHTFTCYTLRDSPAIWGFPKLEQLPCYGLQPGERIIKMGAPGKNGKETSDNRIVEFTLPMTYRGQIRANEVKPGQYGTEVVYAAFQVSDDLLKRDLFSPEGHLYLLFIITEHGYLWQERFRLQNIFTYRAVFERV